MSLIKAKNFLPITILIASGHLYAAPATNHPFEVTMANLSTTSDDLLQMNQQTTSPSIKADISDVRSDISAVIKKAALTQINASDKKLKDLGFEVETTTPGRSVGINENGNVRKSEAMNLKSDKWIETLEMAKKELTDIETLNSAMTPAIQKSLTPAHAKDIQAATHANRIHALREIRDFAKNSISCIEELSQIYSSSGVVLVALQDGSITLSSEPLSKKYHVISLSQVTNTKDLTEIQSALDKIADLSFGYNFACITREKGYFATQEFENIAKRIKDKK